jgi:hypothetical protein
VPLHQCRKRRPILGGDIPLQQLVIGHLATTLNRNRVANPFQNAAYFSIAFGHKTRRCRARSKYLVPPRWAKDMVSCKKAKIF